MSGQEITDGLQNLVIDLSEQIAEASVLQSPPGEVLYPRIVEESETDSREQEIVTKEIERLEKQLLQFTRSKIVDEPLDIPLIKKCKTADVPSVHAAVGHTQKALQRYVKFSGTDTEHCDQNWCLRVEELYNKAEIHSINSSTNDVGVFLDNAKVTIYEFLNSAEIAYMGWGNSI